MFRQTRVRVIHMPTGIVVECDGDRSQHRNRANALKLLRAKLFLLSNKDMFPEHTNKTSLVANYMLPDEANHLSDLTEFRRNVLVKAVDNSKIPEFEILESNQNSKNLK